MNLIYKVLTRLLPNGRAFRAAASSIRGFLEGLTLEPDRVRVFFDDIKNDFLPGTSDYYLEDWYKTLGLFYDSTLPLDQLQSKAHAVWAAFGGQDLEYLQARIDDAGIPVEVLELSYPEASRVGTATARCGVATCYGNFFIPSTPESGVCGVGRVGLARVGFTETSTNVVFYYLVRGEVRDLGEFNQLVALLERIIPAHVVPVYVVEFLDQFARTGVARCGVARVGKDV